METNNEQLIHDALSAILKVVMDTKAILADQLVPQSEVVTRIARAGLSGPAKEQWEQFLASAKRPAPPAEYMPEYKRGVEETITALINECPELSHGIVEPSRAVWSLGKKRRKNIMAGREKRKRSSGE